MLIKLLIELWRLYIQRLELLCVSKIRICILFFTLLSVYSLNSNIIFGSDKDEGSNRLVNHREGSSVDENHPKNVALKSCLSSPKNPKTIRRREQGEEKKVHFDLGKNVVHTVPYWNRSKRTPRKINKKASSSDVLGLKRSGSYDSRSTKKTSSSGSWYYTLQQKVLGCIVFVIVCLVMICYGFIKIKNKKKVSGNRKLSKEKKGVRYYGRSGGYST